MCDSGRNASYIAIRTLGFYDTYIYVNGNSNASLNIKPVSAGKQGGSNVAITHAMYRVLEHFGGVEK